MPLYEYRCAKCNKVFEVMQKFSDAPLTTHEDCGGEVERLISAPGLQFKGSGWYITDYARSGSGSKSGASPASSSASSESKSDSGSSSSDAKPAAPAASSTPKKE